MKRFIKNNLKVVIAVVITAIVVASITVYATEEMIESNDVRYKNKTVEASLDELYVKANAKNLGAEKICKLIDTTYGRFASVGSEYECTVGTNDGTDIKYNFYLLADNNDNTVDLIMDININSGTMTWNNAMKYIKNNNLKTNWENVLDVDLPKAQDIVNAVGRSEWIAADSGATWWCFGSKTQDSQSSPYCTNSNQGNYAWLFNHLTGCTAAGCTTDSGATADGYWTRDLISNTANAWNVGWSGNLDYSTVSTDTNYGVRLVITVLKSNLYSE